MPTRLRCEDVMKREVATVGPRDTIHTAARRMREEGVGFLPVCDGLMEPLGVLTDRDIALRVLASDRRPSATTVGEAMTPGVVSCRASDDVSKAEELMAREAKSRIVCVNDEGKLVGVISLSDLAERDRQARVSRTFEAVAHREARPHRY